jgi:tetrapyrrole methylase family protein/MazG family protein
MSNFKKLIETTKQLRSENGCPWDKEQTFESLKPYIIEEAYEVISALDNNDYKNLKEEVGDLLLQVLFISNIAEEQDTFSIDDVISELNKKLIERHPHVFGEKSAKTSDEAKKIWDEQKKETQPNKDLSLVYPSTYRAIKVSKFYSKKGLEFTDINEVFNKLNEEIHEFRDALITKNKSNMQSEMGDILFTISNLCRLNHLDPEIALSESTNKFITRAEKYEKIKNNNDISNNEAWDKAKL